VTLASGGGRLLPGLAASCTFVHWLLQGHSPGGTDLQLGSQCAMEPEPQEIIASRSFHPSTHVFHLLGEDMEARWTILKGPFSVDRFSSQSP
jgi:hypothetical protein